MIGLASGAPQLSLKSFDGSRCFGTVCDDSMPGGANNLPLHVAQNSEYPIVAELTAPAAVAYTLSLAVSDANGGCEFSTVKAYPAAHVTEKGYPNEADRKLGSRPWEQDGYDNRRLGITPYNPAYAAYDMCTVRDSRMQVPCAKLYDRSRQPTGYDHIRQIATGQDAGNRLDSQGLQAHDSNTGFAYDNPNRNKETHGTDNRRANSPFSNAKDVAGVRDEIIGIHTREHTVMDDTYELGHDFRNKDIRGQYQTTLDVPLLQGTTRTAIRYLRCKSLHPVGPKVTAVATPTGGGTVLRFEQMLPVLSPCRYPMDAGPKGANDMHNDGTMLSAFGSGHCTHQCQVRNGSMWYQVELGRNVLIQDVSVENRGNCCGKGDTLRDVRVSVDEEYYRVPLPVGTGHQCGQIRNISGPSAVPVKQDERFPPYGATIDPHPGMDPNSGPIRTLLPSLLSENTGVSPHTMRHKQQTEVFFCHQKQGRYVHIRTHANANHHQMVCEVQLHINLFTPDGGQQRAVDIKVFPSEWNSVRG